MLVFAPVLREFARRVMHDEFVVSDQQEVWTGSQGGNASLRATIIIALADKVHIIDCAPAARIKLGGEVFPIQWQASVERAREGYREAAWPGVIAGQGELPQVFVFHRVGCQRPPIRARSQQFRVGKSSVVSP